MGLPPVTKHLSHSTAFYLIVHGGIFVTETTVMGLMGWIMSPITQGQLTGGDDATGNVPGFVFPNDVLLSMLLSLCDWTLARRRLQSTTHSSLYPNFPPPSGEWYCRILPGQVIFATYLIQTLMLCLGWQNNWSVFAGSCTYGSVLCKSVWKLLVRLEGVATFLIAIILVLTLVDILAALRLWRQEKQSVKRLARMTSKIPDSMS